MMLSEESNVAQNAGGAKTAKSKDKSRYVLELDKAKMFWTFILSILVLTFVFVFGYWTGQNNAKEYVKITSDMRKPVQLAKGNEETKDLFEEETDHHSTQKNESEKTTKQSLPDDKLEQELSNDSKKESHKSVAKIHKKSSATVTVKAKKSPSHTKSVAKITKSGSKKYAIQLASFTNEKRAKTLREELLGKGFGGYVIKQGRVYRVRVGNFYTYQNAATILAKVMKRFRIKDAYIFNLDGSKKA